MFSNLNANKFHLLTVPLKDGSKFFIYFRKFNPQTMSTSPNDKSLYEVFKNYKIPKNAESNQKISKKEDSEDINILPTKRTLLCINLDKEFIEAKLKKIFRCLGKIRKIYLGNFKNNKKLTMNEKNPKIVYFAFLIFHKEADVRKAFEIEWFQSQINDKYKFSNLKADKDDKDKYAYQLLENYGDKDSDDDNKNNFIQKMEEDGFTVVLNNQGSVNLDKKVTKFAETKPPKSKYLDNFYKFQQSAKEYLGENEMIQGMDPAILLKRKKKKLIEDFEKDKEKLKKVKID